MASLLSWGKRLANTINNDVAQPIQRLGQRTTITDPVRPFTQPAVQNIGGFVKGTAQALGAPVEEARMLSGALGNNKAAFLAANQRAKNDLGQVAGFAQFLPRAVTELGQSINPAGGDVYQRQLTPQGTFQKALLGSQPISSVQNIYKTDKTKFGASYAAGDVVLHTLMDVLALKGGVEGTKKAINAVKPGVPVSEIPISKLTSYEGAPDRARVEAYKNQIQNGQPIEPIKVARDSKGNLGIEDGKHRVQALKELGIKSVPVTPKDVPIKAPTKLEAQTAMHDILNSGGTIDEALDNYMKKTNSTYGGAQIELNKLLNSGAIDKGKINTGLNPQLTEGKPLLPTVEKGNLTQPSLNRDFVRGKIQETGAKAVDAVNKLSPKDIALMDSVRSTPIDKLVKQAENPKAFQAAAEQIKNYNDYTHALGSGVLGQEVPYRKNYGAPLLFEQSPEEIAIARKAALKTNPGYAQRRSFKDYNEAAQFGLTRRNPTIAHDLASDISRRSNDLSQLTLAKGLNEALPGQVKIGEIGSTPEGTYKQLQIPGGQKISLPSDIADQINARVQPTPSTGLTAKYDTANAFLKYAKLSGGAFHAFTEAGNFVGQQLVSGKLFTEPGSTGKVFKTFFSDKALRSEVGELAKNGTLDKANLGGLTWTPSEIKADVNVTPTGKVSQYTGIKALHDATFQREIPYAKLKTFEQATQGLDPNIPEDLAKIRSAAKGINEGYGGINRIAEGLTPKQAKITSRLLLATDFTEGKIRTIVAAISKGGPEGKIARQIVAGKALLFAGLATVGGIAGGEFQGKKPEQVAENILANFGNPTFKAGGSTVSFPSTHISEFGKPLSTFVNGSKDKFSGLKTYATNRLAALPSEANQLINNLDYSGNHIYGTETKKTGGGPISAPKTALNVASGVLPIPAAQGIDAAQGKQGFTSAIANIAGLKVRPDNNAQPGAGTSSAPNKYSPQVKAQSTKELADFQKKAGTGYGLAQLSDGRYAYNIDGEVKTTTDIKSFRQAIAEDILKKSSDSYKVVGETIYRKSPDGSITKTPKTKFDYQVGAATLVAQKSANDLGGWLKTADSQLKSIQKQLGDQNIDPLDALTLQNQAQALIDNIAKYKEYGGFTKPKAGKKLSTASFKTGGKAPKIPSIKVRTANAKFKAPTTRKLSVNRIPSSASKRKLA